jgi:hypothetical protein
MNSSAQLLLSEVRSIELSSFCRALSQLGKRQPRYFSLDDDSFVHMDEELRTAVAD